MQVNRNPDRRHAVETFDLELAANRNDSSIALWNRAGGAGHSGALRRGSRTYHKESDGISAALLVQLFGKDPTATGSRCEN
jgi:hypothetical protein